MATTNTRQENQPERAAFGGSSRGAKNSGLAEPVPHSASHGSPARVAVLDLVRYASRKPTMHGLVEVDVTSAREPLALLEGSPTLISFVVATRRGCWPNTRK
jgi:hypothetical protein